MSLVVALDAGPLGLVTNPKRSPENLACAQWLQALVAAGARVVLRIADYELRRDLMRGHRQQGLRRIDARGRDRPRRGRPRSISGDAREIVILDLVADHPVGDAEFVAQVMHLLRIHPVTGDLPAQRGGRREELRRERP